MSRPILLASSVCWIVISAAPAVSEEPEDPKQDETIVVPDTGGEAEGAAQAETDAVENAIVERTNAFRRKEGREPVEVDETLTAAAKQFAAYMAETGRYGHEADDRTPDERVTAAGYEYCTVRENIAYAFRSTGFPTEELAGQFVDGWKNSPGHRRNMLDEFVTETGVAVAKSEKTDVYFAVQLFARPRSAAVAFEIANESDREIEYRIGERTFPLPPRLIRTHGECRPQAIEFLPATAETDASSPPDPVARIDVSGGERLTVVADGDGYRVEVRENEVAPPAPDPGPKPETPKGSP